MGKKFLGFGFLILVALSSCAEKDTTFLITEEKVGKLDKISLVRDLELIYEGDSIVKDTFQSQFGSQAKKIMVYEKGGKHLVTLTPSDDSIPTIQNVRVIDKRFETVQGIGLNSTFKDILDTFTIKKITTTLNNVVVFVKESDVYFTIAKDELPANLRFSTSNIEAVQIPDDAKIKYLSMGWHL
ncbi:MAG: hypothetical protein ED555_07535 [Allomuricauda sp.]|nr:MAG: hypothetical protein ED555_07535 [Allomuricauda sp.]